MLHSLKIPDSSKLHFVSDTHFYHANILRFSERPFASVEEMNEALVSNWNDRVQPTDIVFHLGDVSFGSAEHTEKILNRLNGQIHLIIGNHDHMIKKRINLQIRFASINSYQEIKVNDPESDKGSQRIALGHYALRVWNQSHYGAWNCFGHSHGTLPELSNSRSIDVGVDATAKRFGVVPGNYRPISYAEVKAVMRTRIWTPVDYHEKRK